MTNDDLEIAQYRVQHMKRARDFWLVLSLICFIYLCIGIVFAIGNYVVYSYLPRQDAKNLIFGEAFYYFWLFSFTAVPFLLVFGFLLRHYSEKLEAAHEYLDSLKPNAVDDLFSEAPST